MRYKFYAGLIILSASLTGCSLFTGTPVPKEAMDLPEKWSSQSGQSDLSPQPWLEEFGQPELLKLVGEALERNPDIRSQALAVQIAQTEARLVGADRWPQLSAGLGSSRNKRSNTSGFSLSSVYSTSYNFSLDLEWEVDLWSRLNNGLKAALLNEKAVEADLAAAHLSLVANLVKVWFDGIEARQQIALARKTVESFRESLQIIERGYDRGLYRALDVRLARASLLAASSREQTFHLAQSRAVRVLEVFLGRYPSAQIVFPDHLPTASRPIPAGVPSELLSRRPDIIAMERRFMALDQRHIQAKKNRLPSIRLTASGGTSTRKFTDLANTDFLVWNFASGLLQPLFQGGRLDALRDEAKIRLQQAAADYQRTVLQAFSEVETTLASEQFLRAQEKSLVGQASEASEAEQLAREDYVSGLTDISTLLLSQRQAFEAENNLLSIRKARLQNRVNLYLALGGPFVTKTSETAKK